MWRLVLQQLYSAEDGFAGPRRSSCESL
jgi:hypothetical protein